MEKYNNQFLLDIPYNFQEQKLLRNSKGANIIFNNIPTDFFIF